MITNPKVSYIIKDKNNSKKVKMLVDWENKARTQRKKYQIPRILFKISSKNLDVQLLYKIQGSLDINVILKKNY
jgi:hypothetical protein